jgi:hypothetical protein
MAVMFPARPPSQASCSLFCLDTAIPHPYKNNVDGKNPIPVANPNRHHKMILPAAEQQFRKHFHQKIGRNPLGRNCLSRESSAAYGPAATFVSAAQHGPPKTPKKTKKSGACGGLSIVIFNRKK